MGDITIVQGAYKPTYNWGAPHCMKDVDCLWYPVDVKTLALDMDWPFWLWKHSMCVCLTILNGHTAGNPRAFTITEILDLHSQSSRFPARFFCGGLVNINMCGRLSPSPRLLKWPSRHPSYSVATSSPKKRFLGLPQFHFFGLLNTLCPTSSSRVPSGNLT
jgi:hypothetical protein